MNVAQRLNDIFPSPTEDVRRLAGNVHELTGRVEYSMNYFLDEIEAKHVGGWSPNTLLAIWLTNDAKTLRELADHIDTIKQRLTQENLT